MDPAASSPAAPFEPGPVSPDLAPNAVSCVSCGSPLEATDKFCPACGTAHDVVEPAAAPADSRHIRCRNCGAEVQVPNATRSYVCPFCDSAYVEEFAPSASGRQEPEFVLGFAVPAEKAHDIYRGWIASNSWFRPGDLVNAHVIDKIRGVYLPFWSFSMLAESGWSASIGEHWYRTETYTVQENGKTVTKTRQVQETEWWPLSGRHHQFYSGYLVSGSRGLPQTHADWIQPFPLPSLQRFQPFYLAGWLSEEYSIEREEALARCQEEFYRRATRDISAFMPGDTHRDVRVKTHFSAINSDLILLPVYIFSYHYQNKLYRFLINGQTGKCAGEKPVAWGRVAVAVLVGLLIVGVIAAILAVVAGN